MELKLEDVVAVISLKSQEVDHGSDGWFIAPKELKENETPEEYKFHGYGRITSFNPQEHIAWPNVPVKENDIVVQECVLCQYDEKVWNMLIQN